MPELTEPHGEPRITQDGGTSPIKSAKPRSQPTDEKEPSYILWFLTIFMAVTLGNLASLYITAKITEYQLTQAIGEIGRIGEAALRDIQQRSAAQQAQLAQQQRQQRINSPIGIKLERECSEWTLNHAQTKSSYAAMERNKRCGQLQHYIDTGAVPR